MNISKHLMLRLINRSVFLATLKRGYFKTSYVTVNPRWGVQHTHRRSISKHLMLRLIERLKKHIKKAITYFKTSYVTVNHLRELIGNSYYSNFKTSYVTVNLLFIQHSLKSKTLCFLEISTVQNIFTKWK